jgi:uncharacterized phage protein (TIGR01671 family)
MDRTIKFRGKRTDNGQWVYGYYAVLQEKHYIIYTNDKELFTVEVIPDTVGQFTGLRDTKTNKEVYEDDILSVNNGKWPKLVKFINDKTAFCMANVFELNVFELKKEDWLDIWYRLTPVWWRRDFKHEIEIIGNIHDNPELLTIF